MQNFNLFSILALLAGLLTSCSPVKPITVKRFDDFKVKTLSTKPAVSFSAVISNPNSFGVTLKSFSANVFLGKQPISAIETTKKTRIASQADISIPFEAYPDLKGIGGMLLQGQVSSHWETTGNVVISKFIFRKKIPFSLEGDL
ncbi:MAG: LEA type 2 family protein [Bacteroidia bacterium]|nr:LEA type 2 family protein [Bacteroidia bacterium]MCZ2277283.1 LEA type 2 family protein [Bacteroidia bacterium]